MRGVRSKSRRRWPIYRTRITIRFITTRGSPSPPTPPICAIRKRALPYAKRAAELRGGHNASTLHVLAQAYAGVGDYTQAEETEEKAIATFAPVKPGNPIPVQQAMMEDFLKDIRGHLKK